MVFCIAKEPDSTRVSIAHIEDSCGEKDIICRIAFMVLIAAPNPLDKNLGVCQTSWIRKDWETDLGAGQ